MEYVDVLDKDGKLTGERKPKSEVHRTGDWHRVLHLWIVSSKGELLLQRRSPTKEAYPNLWDISVAGHISAGETQIMAALREAKEEIGLDLEEKDLKHLFCITEQVVLNGGTYHDNECQYVYLFEKDIDLSKISFKDGEVVDARYISYKELEKTVAANPKDFVPHAEEYRLLFKELHKRYS